MEYTIQTNDLGKQYGSHWAIQNISLHVPMGMIYGLLGRNGAGKTTIMKLLLGLSKRTTGEIMLFGQNLTGDCREVYSRIGSTIESPGFYPNLTASENLAVFARLRGKVERKKI